MARSWQYPRWRRYAMQATMWLLLAATVGLAAFVNHERRRALRVELGGPISDGWLAVRLPRTWQPSASLAAHPAAAERDPRVIARAVEPDEQGLGRTVTITRDRLPSPISPHDYLLFVGNHLLGLDLSQANNVKGKKELVEPVTVGGWPGVLVRGVRASSRGAAGARSAPHKEIYAATVLPSGHAVVVKLEGDRPAELSDVEIIKQLAGAIEIGGQPTLGQSGETIALEGGIRLSAPEGFRPVYENDEHLPSRRLWPDGEATRWSAVQLVPCVLAPPAGSSADETLAIKALAAVHDPALRDATVSPAGARRWRITPPLAAGATVRGYLIADELGDAGTMTAGPRRAMMAFFYGTPATADAAPREAIDAPTDAAWDAIARGVSFLGKTDFGTLFEAGAAEVARIRSQGLEQVLGSNGVETWGIWWDGIEKKHVGWSYVKWNLTRKTDTNAPPSGGSMRGVFRGPDGRPIRAKSSWTHELRKYDAFNTRLPAAPGEAVMRHTVLNDGKLVIDLASGGRPIAHGSGEAPAQFLPGAWVPMLLGKLSPQQAMILHADSFLPGEPIGAPVPLTLIVHPISERPAAAAAANNNALAADGTPLRCLAVRVNGASEASRWYFTAKGEVHHVTFARQLRWTPSEEKTVLFNFDPEVTAPW